jgi:hypothetical protein
VQCWFPGVHVSVGGGSDPDEPTHTQHEDIAQLTLHWMISLLRPLLAIEADTNMQDHYRSSFIKGEWIKNCRVKDSYPEGLLKYLKVRFLAGGDLPRSPGQYDENNNVNLEYIATDTREYIHPSVRVRWGHDADPETYPKSLGGFDLRVSREGNEPTHSGWEWVKKLPDGRELIIPEWKFQKDEGVMDQDSDAQFAQSPLMYTIMADPRS